MVCWSSQLGCLEDGVIIGFVGLASWDVPSLVEQKNILSGSNLQGINHSRPQSVNEVCMHPKKAPLYWNTWALEQ